MLFSLLLLSVNVSSSMFLFMLNEVQWLLRGLKVLIFNYPYCF